MIKYNVDEKRINKELKMFTLMNLQLVLMGVIIGIGICYMITDFKKEDKVQ